MLPMAIFSSFSDLKVYVLIMIIAISSLFASIGGVSWLAWMSDLIPENIRGSYFGKRNMFSLTCGTISVILGGYFLSFWAKRFGETDPYGYIILFSLGITAGIISMVILMQIPEVVTTENSEKKALNFQLFLSPLKDTNFRKLILLVSIWIFGIQLAGPFYAVFMLNNLKMKFSTITIFGAFAMLSTIFMMKIWGSISDKMGNKPVITVSSLILILVPLLWIFATKTNYYVLVLLAHILTGAFMAGISLSQFNIVLKLSPQNGRSVYLALYAAITGLTGGIAPIAGGAIMQMFNKLHFSIFSYEMSNLQVIFILSMFVQIMALFFINRIQEPKASTPMAVILQLKNDLNPQTGIASTTDFLIVKAQETKNVFKSVDEFTDKIVEISETKIESLLDKCIKAIEKPIKKIRDFFKD